MKIQIVNVSVAQSAKVLTALYMLMSFPFIVIGAIFGASNGSVGLTVLAMIIAPLVYGLFIFLCTGLVVWLYNVVAQRVGGLEYRIAEMPGPATEA